MSLESRNLTLAIVAGFIITVAAMIAVTPVYAASNQNGYPVYAHAEVANIDEWEHLTIRDWPGLTGKKIGQLSHAAAVWVTNCIIVANSSDWCEIDNGSEAGWVSANYLSLSQR